jgi:hypothetical protein
MANKESTALESDLQYKDSAYNTYKPQHYTRMTLRPLLHAWKVRKKE